MSLACHFLFYGNPKIITNLIWVKPNSLDLDKMFGGYYCKAKFWLIQL